MLSLFSIAKYNICVWNPVNLDICLTLVVWVTLIKAHFLYVFRDITDTSSFIFQNASIHHKS